MISEAQTYLGRAPWYALFVGLAIVLMILGLSLLTEGLQQRRRAQRFLRRRRPRKIRRLRGGRLC